MSLLRRYHCVVTLSVWIVGLAAAADPWRLVVVGDSRGSYNGVNTPILTEIAAQLVAEQPDVVVFPGDLVDGSSNTATLIAQLNNWVLVMQPVYNAGIRVLSVRGNHEDQGSVSAWNTVFAGQYAMPANGPAGELNCTYSLAYKNALLVGLDVYLTHPHRVNQAWLNTQLQANRQPHVFVFAHDPAFKAYHPDCLGSYPADRDIFWQSLTAARAHVYFCGHDHIYDHARIDDGDGNPANDLHQEIIATGGAPLYVFNGDYNGANGIYTPIQQFDESNYGYVVVDVAGLNVTLTWKHRVAAGSYTPAETWSYRAVPAQLPGDLNCDGAVDFDDINPFVLILSNPAQWQAEFPGCPWQNGDCNADGFVNFDDINPFVALLTGGE